MEFRSMFHRRVVEDAARDLGVSVDEYIEQQKHLANEDRRETAETGGWYEWEDTATGEWSVWLKVPDGKDTLVSARGISHADALLMVQANAAQLEGGK